MAAKAIAYWTTGEASMPNLASKARFSRWGTQRARRPRLYHASGAGNKFARHGFSGRPEGP